MIWVGVNLKDHLVLIPSTSPALQLTQNTAPYLLLQAASPPLICVLNIIPPAQIFYHTLHACPVLLESSNRKQADVILTQLAANVKNWQL